MKIPKTALPPLLHSVHRDGYAVHSFAGSIGLVFGAEEIVCCFPVSEELALERCILILEAIQRHRRLRRLAGHRLAMMVTSGRM